MRSANSTWRRRTVSSNERHGRRRRTAALLVALGTAGAVGCRESTVCPADLQLRVTPAERTLAVGESFTPTAEAFGCGGTRRVDEVWTWETADTDIVSVDPLTGRTTGQAPGTAVVRARGRTYGLAGNGVRVTVH